MPRLPSEYRALHEAADKAEPRLARAVLKALERIRGQVSINDLAIIIARAQQNDLLARWREVLKDVDRALALLPLATIRDALSPAGPIVKDALLKGGRLGAEQVNKA